MKRVLSKILPSLSVLAMLAASPAHAQNATDEVAEDTSEEIVVTGTSIRGIAPAGAQQVGLGTEAIEASNAPSTVQLLTQIPQISGFNSLQAAVPVGPRQTTNIPTIRGLRATNSGSSPTLLLVDGRRVAGAGIVQTIGDPDVVSPGALARVEVVPDGGSAVYGADAVGGVINLITRSEFDGVDLNIKQGIGDEYMSTDANLTIGRRWDGGSIYATYGYSYHDAIYARDRDYVRDISYNATNPDTLGLPLGRGCGEGSLSVGGNNYLIVDGAPQTTVATPEQYLCDLSKYGVIYPEERRDSVFAGLTQELNDWLTFDLRAYYMQRQDDYEEGIGTTPTFTPVTPSNDFYPGVAGLPGGTQTVYYNYLSLPGRETNYHLELATWGIAPQLTADLGHDWQMRAFLNYSLARTTMRDPGISGEALALYHDQINFYDLPSTDPGIIDQLLNGPGALAHAWGEDEITNGRIVFDGPALTLPAGELRVAVGAEYLGENFSSFQSVSAPADASRRSHGFFVEANIPIVSPQNNIPLVSELTVDLAARRDSYSDFGSVTTPRVGVTYAPIDWVSFRGAYGQSFQAPSLVDVAAAGQSRFFFTSPLPVAVFSGFQPILAPLNDACDTDNDAGTPNTCYMAVVAGSVPLDAQRAETFSIGLDISPPIVEGLEMGLTYWHIDYAGIVDQPPFLDPDFFTDPSFAQFRDFNPAGAFAQSDVNAFLAGAGMTQSQIDTYLANNPQTEGNFAVLIDLRTRNLGARRLAGWDGYIRYAHDTSFGSWFADVNATWQATDKLDVDGSAFNPNTADDGITPRWNATATIGATIGDDWAARATLLYTPSYDRPGGPTDTNGNQSEIEASHPINLNVDYDGFGDDLSLSLGLNNVFDEDPPQFNGTSPNGLTRGYVGGNLGRVLYIGFDKQF